MKTLVTIFLATVLSVASVFATNDLDRELLKYYATNKVAGKNEKVTDYTMARRLYIDIAGRIPSPNELKAYVSYNAPDKKQKLIDKLLFSEDYVNNFYNVFADMLRIRPDRLSDDVALLKSYPYIQYVQDNLRLDKPYDVWVKEMMTAKGTFQTNPATGYMLRDNGMALDNLATSVQLFIGKDIACAQCHDDPFQDYSQKQFYQLYAFVAQEENRANRKDYKDLLTKVDAQIKDITKKDRIDNNVRQLLAANLFDITENDKKEARLPHDFKYEKDGKPNDVVEPVTFDGKVKGVKGDRREALANWLITQDDFSYSIVNRIWGELVGKPLIEPVVNFDVKNYPEGKIIVFLGNKLKANNYSLKSLIRLIIESDFYNRVAYDGPTEAYKLQAPLVKRMSPYQVWDSILSVVIPDVNYTRINFSEYSKLVTVNWETVSGQGLLDQMKSIQEYEQSLSKNFLKYKGIELVRSAYLLNKNNFTGLFLKEFGSSDRVLIDTANNDGSVSQILVLMNSPLIDLINSKESQLMAAYEAANKNKEIIFISLLARLPSIQEKAIIEKTNINDLIWALMNTREFIFRS
jgi:hypothetical protein